MIPKQEVEEGRVAKFGTVADGGVRMCRYEGRHIVAGLLENRGVELGCGLRDFEG